MRLSGLLIAAALAVAALPAAIQGAADKPAQDLRVGAGRASITLPVARLPLPFKRIRDDVFVRVLIADSGGQRVAVVIADAPMFQADVGMRLKQRIATRLRIDPAHVLLGVSHTHNNVRADPNPGGIILPGSPIFVELFESATMAAVEQAAGRMQPARLAIGSGRVALVGAKNAWSPRHQRVIEAIDRTGTEPVNERLGVLRFDALDGKPIAVLLNYGINPVVAMPLKDAISGDVPGAASRYVEARLGGDAVALFTLGAAGNPRYRADSGDTYGSPDPEALLQAMGTIIGEEALAAARAAEPASGLSRLGGRTAALICPGKITTPLNLPDRCAHEPGSSLPACTFTDGPRDPVTLQMGALQIGPVVLVQSDADISAPVGMKLERLSPLASTWTVSLNYGPMRYVVADADYPRSTYEATATTARSGCAEQGFIRESLRMIGELGRAGG